MNKITQIRTWLGISQRELAKWLGTTNATLSRYEAGHREPSEPIKKLIDLIVNVPGVSDHLKENRSG